MTLCLFDIDGTLISSLGAGKAALESALMETFGLTALQGSVVYSGRTDTAIAADLLRLHGLPATPAARAQLHDAYLRNLPRALTERPGRVLPGIAALLNQLAARDEVHLGLLTGNLRRGAAVKLGHYQLDHHFAFGGYGDELHDRDEVAHAALANAVAHLGTRPAPDRVWVLGDTPLDVKCARAIGAKAVAIATGMHTHEELESCRPDLLVQDLADPEPFLRLLA